MIASGPSSSVNDVANRVITEALHEGDETRWREVCEVEGGRKKRREAYEVEKERGVKWSMQERWSRAGEGVKDEKGGRRKG